MTAKELKASILDLAVRGKLVPQDPNDEPASVLLEKIRAEKQKLVKAGKIKKEKNPSEIYIASDGRPYEKFADGSETCIEDEVPFDLPPGWAWARLGNVVNIVSARRVHQNDWQTSGVPFYRAREIVRLSESGEADNELFISEELFAEFSKSGRPKPNDLMVTAVGTIGTCYIVKPNDRFYYKDATVLCFENIGHISADYLLHLMHSPYMHNLMHSKSAGTTVNTITMVKANNYLIPLPPLAEQHRIITKIKGLMSKVGEYAKAAQQFAEFEAKFPADLKKAILQAAVEGKLVPQDQEDEPASVLVERIAEERRALVKAGKLKRDKHESVIFRGSDRLTYETRDGETVCIEDDLPFKVPESWAWVRLNSLGTFVGGHTPSLADHTNWDNGNVIWITSKDMKSKYIVDSGEKLSAKGAKELQLLPPETILMVTRSGILKHTFPVAIAKTHLTINQDQRALRLHCPDMSEFVYVLLRGLEGRILRDFVKKGTTVQSILWDKFINMPIPLPPLAEQRRIVAEVKRMETQVALLQ